MEEWKVGAQAPDRKYMEEAARIWTLSSITLIDMRRQTLYSDHPVRQYRLPSSMFVFAYGGKAEVRLDGMLCSVERFGLLHGGKGSSLTILPTGGKTECYFVYYKAEEPAFYQKELRRLLKMVDPFKQIYGFAPRNPLYMAEMLERMLERWPGAVPLGHFYGKTGFYQLVYEIYEELGRGDVDILQPDPVTLVKQYMDEHYREAISLGAIAGIFHISASQLSRLFKKQEGMSPQEYWIRRRVEAARTQLMESDATLREIAWSCGFSDEFNLIKTFKSQLGMTPGDWRKMSSIALRDSAMGIERHIPYSYRRLARLDHTTGEREYTMLGSYRSKTMMAAAALSLLLTLSACGTSAPAATNAISSESPTVQAATAQPTATQAAEAGTREYEHAAGKSVIPAEPRRIVADWFYGELMALGVRPIGYPEYLLSEYRYVDTNGTETFGESLESVVAMEPDLIITTWDDSYEPFSKIAPSVLLKLNSGLVDKMRVLGELVNRQDEAKKWEETFLAKLEAAKKRIAEEAAPDTTVTILSIFQKDLKVYGYRNMGGDVLYNLLEVKPPAKVKEMFDDSDVWNKAISFEGLPEVAGTHIILTAYDPEGTGRETLEQSQVWNNLDAVKNGRVHKVDYYDLFFDDPIAIEHQIEMLTNMIVE